MNGARPTREQVFQTLFDHLIANTDGFETYSRRMMQYSEVAPRLMPILMLWEQPEETEFPHRGLPVDVWEAMIVIVFQNTSLPRNGDPNSAVPGATIINPLIDEVRNALAPDDETTNSLTFDGMVQWCRVEGRTIVETGDTETNGRGGAIIPVRILVP